MWRPRLRSGCRRRFQRLEERLTAAAQSRPPNLLTQVYCSITFSARRSPAHTEQKAKGSALRTTRRLTVLRNGRNGRSIVVTSTRHFISKHEIGLVEGDEAVDVDSEVRLGVAVDVGGHVGAVALLIGAKLAGLAVETL